MIRVEHLQFSYNSRAVIQDLSFEVADGEFLGIIGPNGAGKSTLLKLLDGILQPEKGKIIINNRVQQSYSQRSLARVVGFVPQIFTTSFNYCAFDIVMMGRFPHQKIWGFESKKDINIVEQVMKDTDCYYLRNRSFLSLSGGEQKRVILSSALAQEPRILLLDEPTTSLDLKHQIHFFNILKKLQKEKRITILTVTHDVNLAAQFCQHLLALKNGKIVAYGPVKKVLQKNILEEIYETGIEISKHPETGIPVILPKISNVI